MQRNEMQKKSANHYDSHLIVPRGFEQNFKKTSQVTGQTYTYKKYTHKEKNKKVQDWVHISGLSPQLIKIVISWDKQPQHIKDAILTLIHSTKR